MRLASGGHGFLEYTKSMCVCLVLAEELGKDKGSFRSGLQKMLLDGSLQEVRTILSKALYGEPLVNESSYFIY